MNTMNANNPVVIIFLIVIAAACFLFIVSPAYAMETTPAYRKGTYECAKFTCQSYDSKTGQQNGFVFIGTKLHVKKFFRMHVQPNWGNAKTVILGQSFIGPVGGDLFDMAGFTLVQ